MRASTLDCFRLICGGNHHAIGCPQRKGRCFRCGQVGHLSRECPGGASPASSAASVQFAPRQLSGLPPAMSAGRSSVPRQPEGPRPAPSGQVFAAQVEQPAVADDVVAGIVLINGTRTRALFDTGASNSFINVSFAKAHDIEISDSPDAWWVYAPEYTFSVKEECAACQVQIGYWIMPADLLVLSRMKGFDIILGIDWLSKCNATIDCEQMSASRARKLINSRCVAYLASVVETQKELPILGDISVLCEFPNVFPTELSGLPSDWEIEFVIDLVPRTAPISKALYIMAPAELKE
uniref:CCHC-type domain-containing protein n=1 Tax=Ananas comosus var. bracteatus TaxID=296719 RepID=A0A6V7P509_ANACO|nr:unnamed protein product [Ananas comosus var. bracteatus]